MMFKLSLISVKKRWKDYLVLMMGLMISISIFYMFQTLSLNKGFLEKNILAVAMVAIVFELGAFLLSIITVVYVFYANSFLLSMRKKEYGMYMMLGAKKRKISQMMAIETLFIGLVSTLIGLLLGTALAHFMGTYLSESIDLPSNTYVAFVPKALVVTLVFFTLLFLLTTLVNVFKFRQTKTLDLLYSESQSERHIKKPIKIIAKIILAVLLMGIGYYCMVHITSLQVIGVFIAIVTITSSTFLLFSTLIPVVVDSIKSWEKFSGKDIRIFTLSQLSFKASSLSRVLAMVTMLLALSLGAVTVGTAFKNFSNDLLSTSFNDVVVYDPTPEIQKELDKLDKSKEKIYHSKKIDDTRYFIQEEMVENPLFIQKENEVDSPYIEYKELKVNHIYNSENKKDEQIVRGFNQLKDNYRDLSFYGLYQVVSLNDFNQIAGIEETVLAIQVEEYTDHLSAFKKIDELEKERSKKQPYNSGKYDLYQQIKGMSNGFMFMGFFLGIAFLAMLASCLMFKILTGAYQDVQRYNMLHKIGVKRNQLKNSIRKEIAAIFLAPAIVGVVHVLVGLQMFTVFIPNPYHYILTPFVMYACIYFAYYIVTVLLYQNIVLEK